MVEVRGGVDLDWVVEVDLVKDGKYQADSKWVCSPRLEMPQTG